MLKGKTVVLGVTGSIAAYKIANLASALVKLHADVHVIMTQNATNFINPITFETLTNNKCLVDTFDRNFQFNVEHVSLAKQTGAAVEAEIGCMGKRESGSGTGGADPSKVYTDPDQAADFVKRSGVDALACSFGTTHGVYLTKPQLDFSVVENVRKKANNVPVVMHGGSGVSKELLYIYGYGCRTYGGKPVPYGLHSCRKRWKSL